MDLSFRDYRHGDEIKILELFEKCFGKKLSPLFWKWRFLDNPAGKGIIRLAFDSERLVGHYAVVPVSVSTNSNEAKCGLSMTTMTDPEYGGRGIFSQLAQQTYDKCQVIGIKFIYGFPNKNSHHGFVTRLGWHDFGEMNVLCKNLSENIRDGYGNTTKTSHSIEEITKFDSRIDDFFASLDMKNMTIIKRSSEFLNWRFVQNTESQNYKIFVSFSGEKITGYIVIKIFQSNNMKRGHLIDFLSIDDDVFSALLAKACDYFDSVAVHDISCWAPVTSNYYKVLLNNGFKSLSATEYFGVPTYIGIKTFGEFSLENVKNWYITMCDSDVF